MKSLPSENFNTMSFNAIKKTVNPNGFFNRIQ